MEENKEITALFHLIDDPDEEVFDLVSKKIADYGRPIIPNLEHLWENTPSEEIQERIELIIHRLHFGDLHEDFRQWCVSGHHDLVAGALLTCKFQYPDLSITPVVQEIEKVKRNIWLELNNYLTPLEQIHIVTSILFSYYGLKGSETVYTNPNDFLLHKVLESKKGNQVSNGIIYLVLCEMLDIPVKAIAIPNQFILGYMRPGYSDEEQSHPFEKIELFIDGNSGQAFTHKDVEEYFRRINVPMTPSCFRAVSNKQVMQTLLGQYSRCFSGDKNQYKQTELQQLIRLLD